MQGILLGLVALLGLYCIAKQLKLNADEVRKSELEDKLDEQRAENARLRVMLNGRHYELKIKTIGY